jgi:hypothetical protein
MRLSTRRIVSRRGPNPDRRALRPWLETLADRCLLSVVTLGAATQADARTVAIDYTIDAPVPSALTVNVYRSTVPQLGGAGQVAIGAVILGGADVTLGAHTGVHLGLTERAPGVNALAIDPSRPYVIAAATGSDGLTSSASYRTIVVGLVTHGFNATDTPPAWIYQIATSLSSLGYNEAIPFSWATASHTLQSGEGIAAGKNAAQMIENYLTGTNGQGQPNVPTGAVVDLHLIGHSRGSVVITQAMQTLQDDLAKIPQARGGYWELTYLDPHPSHGTNVAPFSATTQAALDAANALQNIFQDPYPLTVPAQVAAVQIDYENTPVSEIESVSEEGQLNPWGITNPSGIQPTPGASTQFQMLNLTTAGMSHSGVYQWYQANVVPTLGTASPFVTGPIDAPIDANGEALSADAGSLEFHRVAYFADLDPNLSASDFTATINWGDGSGTQSALVVGFASTGYFVVGLHDYFTAATYNYSVTIQHTGGSQATVQGTVNVTMPTLVSGSQPGQAPQVTITQAGTGAVVSQFLALGSKARGGVRVAVGDVNGDGIPDILAASGPGDSSEVRIFDGRDHHLLRTFSPFGRRDRGGLAISAGTVDTDGLADIAVGNSAGMVKVFSGADGSLLARFSSRGTSFRRGTGLNVDDIDRDGLSDIVVRNPRGSIRKLVSGHSLAQQRAKAFLALAGNPKTLKTILAGTV